MVPSNLTKEAKKGLKLPKTCSSIRSCWKNPHGIRTSEFLRFLFFWKYQIQASNRIFRVQIIFFNRKFLKKKKKSTIFFPPFTPLPLTPPFKPSKRLNSPLKSSLPHPQKTPTHTANSSSATKTNTLPGPTNTKTLTPLQDKRSRKKNPPKQGQRFIDTRRRSMHWWMVHSLSHEKEGAGRWTERHRVRCVLKKKKKTNTRFGKVTRDWVEVQKGETDAERILGKEPLSLSDMCCEEEKFRNSVIY